MKIYTALVTRDGRWWMIAIPELDGLTQARRLSEAVLMAQEYIAATLDLEIDDVQVELDVAQIGSVRDISQRLHQIEEDRNAAAELEAHAAAEVRALARELVDANVPVRDVGALLGVSYQRAHQLAASA